MLCNIDMIDKTITAVRELARIILREKRNEITLAKLSVPNIESSLIDSRRTLIILIANYKMATNYEKKIIKQ